VLLAASRSTATVTTEESRSTTSCDLFSHTSRGSSDPLFLSKYLKYYYY
jgi:hypothetical protein